MDKRAEETNSLYRKFRLEKEKLLEEWLQIKAKCNHPEIGEVFMYICPDCDYNGGPSYPEELSEYDYENYSKNIEKTRALNRTKKAKYTREAIIKMTKEVKEKIKSLSERETEELLKLNKRWDDNI